MPDRNEFAKHIDYPVFGPDPRQGTFHGVIQNVVKPHLNDQGFEAVGVINTTYGWPAAHVNIGWLKEKAEFLHAQGVILTKKDLQDFLFSAVQRGKCVILKDGGGFVEVELVTKDDGGYMEYRFSIHRMNIEFPTEE